MGVRGSRRGSEQAFSGLLLLHPILYTRCAECFDVPADTHDHDPENRQSHREPRPAWGMIEIGIARNHRRCSKVVECEWKINGHVDDDHRKDIILLKPIKAQCQEREHKWRAQIPSQIGNSPSSRLSVRIDKSQCSVQDQRSTANHVTAQNDSGEEAVVKLFRWCSLHGGIVIQ